MESIKCLRVITGCGVLRVSDVSKRMILMILALLLLLPLLHRRRRRRLLLLVLVHICGWLAG